MPIRTKLPPVKQPIPTPKPSGVVTPSEPEITPEEQCKLDGGFWDEKTQRCLRHTPPPEPRGLRIAPAPKPAPTPERDRGGAGIYTDVKTGKPSGIRLPDGKVLLGLDPEEIAEIQRDRGLDLPFIGERERRMQRITEEPSEFGLERPEERLAREQAMAGDEIDRLVRAKYPDMPIRRKGESLEEFNRRYNAWRMKPVSEGGLGGYFDPRGEFRDVLSAENLEITLKSTIGAFAPQLVPIMMNAVSSYIGAKGWSVKGITGKIFRNPKTTAKIGTSVKNAFASRTILEKFAIIGAGYYGLEKLGSLTENIINRGVDEQQQAMNTMGQTTSTIVGDSTSGAGDWRLGLKELRNVKKVLLEQERDIKRGTIQSLLLFASGKMADINADVQDALLTADEGIRDIQTFALQGQFPEVSEFEIQQMLRELEADGFIEPVDLTTARRDVTRR